MAREYGCFAGHEQVQVSGYQPLLARRSPSGSVTGKGICRSMYCHDWNVESCLKNGAKPREERYQSRRLAGGKGSIDTMERAYALYDRCSIGLVWSALGLSVIRQCPIL